MMSHNLDQKSFNAAGPTFLLHILIQFTQIFVGIVLVRLLSPSDYGLWGIFTMISTFATLFINAGFSSALIQKKELEQSDLDSVFYYNLLLGFSFTLGVWFAAPWLATYFNQPILRSLLRLVSWVFPISAIASIQYALLSRRMQQSRAKLSFILGYVFSVPVTFWLAWNGYGVWALAWQLLIAQSATSILAIAFCHWIPGIQFSFLALWKLFRFGSNILLSGLSNTLVQSIYGTIIGKHYSLEELGYYTRAKQYVMLWPSSVQGTICDVLFPAFSQIQDDLSRLKNAARASLQLSVFIIIFPSILLGTLAYPLIYLILSEKWLPIVPYFQIFTIVYVLGPFRTFNHQLILARGRSGISMGISILEDVLYTLGVLLTVKISVATMIWSMVFVTFIALYLDSRYSKYSLQFSLRAQIKDSLPYLLYSLIASSAAYGLYLLLWPINHWLGLFVPMAAGCVIYLLLNVFCYSPAFDTAWRLGKEQLKGWFGK